MDTSALAAIPRSRTCELLISMDDAIMNNEHLLRFPDSHGRQKEDQWPLGRFNAPHLYSNSGQPDSGQTKP